MTRHGKNCTAGAVYTYHEKQQDTLRSGYGTKKMRLGKDSVKEFDCCSLTLQPCKTPLITKDGFLYDKEAILEYIISKKRDVARQLKLYEKQKQKAKHENISKEKAEISKTITRCLSKASSVAGDIKKEQEASCSVSNMKEGKDKELPSFWVPALVPNASPTLIKKPDEKVHCPMSGKVLRMKDLIPVNFTPIKDGDSGKSMIAKSSRWVCAVTNDVLGNSVPSVVLRPSGSVVTVECVEKLIRQDMRDPINGAKLTEKDIIPLQRGASGFAGSGIELKASKSGPALMS